MIETEYQPNAETGTGGTTTMTLPDGGAAAVRPAGGCCPFHDGPETLDGFMAEVLREGGQVNQEGGREVLDTALDLRHAVQTRRDAGACVALLCRLRAQLDGRHYLAFYRVRCWMRRVLAVESSAGRNEPWVRQALPLDFARPEEIEDQSLALWPAYDGCVSPMARVRFVFVDTN
ncbi:hypothetical protein Ga0100231_012550 [Opitutaceae bacterium TAV4]|nr:hypothetical protein Ga0100231_012550 [Opitutaceae bacterium TAV4]RRJ99276.1 hypothetical protein Ga0100230_013835 [Opitutaceae bacterium TAV3]